MNPMPSATSSVIQVLRLGPRRLGTAMVRGGYALSGCGWFEGSFGPPVDPVWRDPVPGGTFGLDGVSEVGESDSAFDGPSGGCVIAVFLLAAAIPLLP